MMEPSQAKRVRTIFLYALIVSVAASAILGVLSIIGDTWDWYDLRILLTTTTISGASICGLACGASLTNKKGAILPLAGIGLALLSGFLLLGGIWMDAESDSYWKTAVSVSTFAVACAHLSLLSMARLKKTFRWVIPAGFVFIFGVAVLVVWMVVRESGSDGMLKLLGVSAIGAATITVITPIFHWLSKQELDSAKNSIEQIDVEIAGLKRRLAQLEEQRKSMVDAKII